MGKRVVLHLSPTHIPSDNRILKELYAISVLPGTALRAIGSLDVDGGVSTNISDNLSIELLDLKTRTWTWLPRALRYTFLTFEVTWRFLMKALHYRPNVIHCHDAMVLPVGAIAKLILGSKLVYDAHELESDKNGQSRLLSIATLIIERVCWPLVDHFISVSPSIVRWYNENLGSKKSTLILNAPYSKIACNDADLYCSKKDSVGYFHQHYGISPRKLVFVYLGLLVPGRSIGILLDAFDNSEIESHIVFVGYGVLASKIAEISRRAPNVHLHAPVPHEQVVSLVQNASVGLCIVENVSLSDYYCLPNKLFEYACAGIPVLASNFPDIRDIVNEYELGACCNVDPSSIAQAILDMEKAPPNRIFSDLTPLSWQAQSARLVDIYTAL